jgi:hypothetical protein
MRGFFSTQDADARSGQGTGLPTDQRAELLADVLARTLEPGVPAPAGVVAALGAEVTALFRAITAVQRAQLERAY